MGAFFIQRSDNVIPQPRVRHIRKSGPIYKFKGLYRTEDVPYGGLVSSTGMSTHKLPVLSPRPSREAVNTLTTGKALFSANGVRCWVDGTSFYYNGVSKGTVTSGAKNMVDFHGKILIFPDLKFYDYENDVFSNINPSYTSATNSVSFINQSKNVPSGSNVEFTHNSIILSSDTWHSDFQAGATILISGCIDHPENNIYATIVSYSTTVLTFANNTFTAGTENVNAVINFSFSALKTTEAGINFTATPNKFQSGDYVLISGCTGKTGNNKYSTITGVTASIISFDPSEFEASTETPAITVKVDMPAIIAATVHNNRVWGIINGDTIYATKQGSYNNWVQEVGKEGDRKIYAWNTETGSSGNFLGITTYKDHVYVFKKDWSARIYGDDSINFGGVTFSNKGPISHKSIVEVNELLFMAGSDNDIYYCAGGAWESVGIQLNETFTDAVAGSDGRNYYLSLNTSSGWKQYVYDTKCEIGPQWMQYDTERVVDYIFMDGYLYALFAGDNKVYKYNSGSETVSSSFELKINPVHEDTYKWYVAKVEIKLYLSSGASVEILDKSDNGSYTSRKTFNTSGYQLCTIVLKQQRSGYYWLKIVGSGQYDITTINTELVRGSAK